MVDDLMIDYSIDRYKDSRNNNELGSPGSPGSPGGPNNGGCQ